MQTIVIKQDECCASAEKDMQVKMLINILDCVKFVIVIA